MELYDVRGLIHLVGSEGFSNAEVFPSATVEMSLKWRDEAFVVICK
jgi:hypothetical protein